MRRLRMHKGLPQSALTGPKVSAAYISRIEAGQRMPSVRALRVVAQALDVTPEFLETGHEHSPGQLLEQRVSDLEVALRLREDTPAVEAALSDLLEEAADASDHRAVARIRVALGLATAHRGDNEAAIEL